MVTKENSQKKTAHFGYKEVPWEEKTKYVNQVFDAVADKYDIMNDLMSFSLHRLWKKFAVELSGIRQGQYVLDLAGGSGDLTEKIARRLCAASDTRGVHKGQVCLVDLNMPMLTAGRERLINSGLISNVSYVQANAEHLPFADNTFDCITIAFGLRNITDKTAALRAMYRILKPGGKVLVLEFSRPAYAWLQSLYDAYSFYLIPVLGNIVTGSEDSYRYLIESIRMHPDQETLQDMIHQAGFEDCVFHNLTGGIVALHKAYKY